MKVININIKELKDGKIDAQLNNLKREDWTELEEKIADVLEQSFLEVVRALADPMISEKIIRR